MHLVAGVCCGTGDEVSIYRQTIMASVLGIAPERKNENDFKMKMLELVNHSMS